MTETLVSNRQLAEDWKILQRNLEKLIEGDFTSDLQNLTGKPSIRAYFNQISHDMPMHIVVVEKSKISIDGKDEIATIGIDPAGRRVYFTFHSIYRFSRTRERIKALLDSKYYGIFNDLLNARSSFRGAKEFEEEVEEQERAEKLREFKNDLESLRYHTDILAAYFGDHLGKKLGATSSAISKRILNGDLPEEIVLHMHPTKFGGWLFDRSKEMANVTIGDIRSTENLRIEISFFHELSAKATILSNDNKTILYLDKLAHFFEKSLDVKFLSRGRETAVVNRMNISFS